MFFKKASPVTKIEQELAGLETRRPKLHSQFVAAEAALDAAREERREFLIGNDSDNATTRAGIEKRLLAGERDVDAFRDALSTIDTKRADAKQRLNQARDDEIREKAASEREQAARAVETATAKLERATENLAQAFDEFVRSIPDASGATIYERVHGPRPATNYEAARAILAEGMFHACAEAFEVISPFPSTAYEISMNVPWRRPNGSYGSDIPKDDDRIQFLPASGAAGASIVAPLRRAAAEIRAGTRPPELLSRADVATIVEPPPFEEVASSSSSPSRGLPQTAGTTARSTPLSAFRLPSPIARSLPAWRSRAIQTRRVPTWPSAPYGVTDPAKTPKNSPNPSTSELTSRRL